jgi:hypothetical protein
MKVTGTANEEPYAKVKLEYLIFNSEYSHSASEVEELS